MQDTGLDPDLAAQMNARTEMERQREKRLAEQAALQQRRDQYVIDLKKQPAARRAAMGQQAGQPQAPAPKLPIAPAQHPPAPQPAQSPGMAGPFQRHQFHEPDPNWRDRFKGQIRDSQVPNLLRAAQLQEQKRIADEQMKLEAERNKISQQRADDSFNAATSRSQNYQDRTRALQRQSQIGPQVDILKQQANAARKKSEQLDQQIETLQVAVSRSREQYTANARSAEQMRVRRDAAQSAGDLENVSKYNQWAENTANTNREHLAKMKTYAEALGRLMQNKKAVATELSQYETQLKGLLSP